jgi:hypothetical protein
MWVELIYGVESATWRSERDMRLLTSYLVDTGGGGESESTPTAPLAGVRQMPAYQA